MRAFSIRNSIRFSISFSVSFFNLLNRPPGCPKADKRKGGCVIVTVTRGCKNSKILQTSFKCGLLLLDTAAAQQHQAHKRGLFRISFRGQRRRNFVLGRCAAPAIARLARSVGAGVVLGRFQICYLYEPFELLETFESIRSNLYLLCSYDTI